MAVNNPFMETSSNFASYTITLVGITVFSDTIIFSTLKHILKHVPHDQVKKWFQWRVMTQINNKFESSTNRANHMIWWRYR